MRKRAHWIVLGRVQGVCFRMSAREEALRLGIAGWVRNRFDGSVELVAEGEERVLQEFAAWCRRGPPGAHVTSFSEILSDPTGEFATFRVLY